MDLQSTLEEQCTAAQYAIELTLLGEEDGPPGVLTAASRLPEAL